MGRHCYVLLRCRHDVPIRCRGDIPLRCLGNVPLRRCWVGLQQLKSNFKRTVNWNKYQLKVSLERRNH